MAAMLAGAGDKPIAAGRIELPSGADSELILERRGFV